MCTGFTFKSNDQVIMGRTMDYTFPLAGMPSVTPRNYYWESRIDYKGRTKYGFIGTGCDMGGYLYGDGVNEHGLAVSVQYARGYASYGTEIKPGKMNIAHTETIFWILGYNQDIDDLERNKSEVNLVADVLDDISEAPPVHYHVSDATGRSVELTFEDGSFNLTENPVGVLTNDPGLDWHYRNLERYKHITPAQHDSIDLEDNVSYKGNENGTYGLPGGYTSPERFVRAAFLKQYIAHDGYPSHDILDAFKILNSVSIPKGVLSPNVDPYHYTLYVTVLNLTKPALYVKWYDSTEITELELTESLITRDEMTFFEPETAFVTRKLN